MNCIQLFNRQAKRIPHSPALWVPGRGAITFGELRELASQAQRLLHGKGLRPGDAVLILDGLGPRLFAAVIAILALGGQVIFVEPWMSLPNLNYAIGKAQPKIFLTNLFGRLWGLRASSIRAIPCWTGMQKIRNTNPLRSLHVESVDGNLPGIITFTSGTTGRPKGVVRSQRYLIDQHVVIEKHLEVTQLHGPDLTIFGNLVLSNLASGRCSLLIPPNWKSKVLAGLDTLPITLKPSSLTCGPAFLMKLMDCAHCHTLQSIHVGGALTDCWILEKGFELWP